MTLNLKPFRLCRSFFITSRNYCEEKSIYQRNEEGPQPRTVYGKPYPDWRKPWIQRDGEWSSKLSIFVEKNPNPNIVNALSKLPNLSMQDVKEWWTSMKELQEIKNQDYLPKRVATLGSNLAALHFFIYRGCAVRLRGSKDWLTGDASTLNLPSQFEEGYYVEAVDCAKFHRNGIRYEGCQSFSGLNFLKWLSLRNNKHVDVWCLDRLAGQNGKTLEYLDIRGCRLCVGSVSALARMSALKTLYITDPGDNIELQAALSVLEEENPHLLINAVIEETLVNSKTNQVITSK